MSTIIEIIINLTTPGGKFLDWMLEGFLRLPNWIMTYSVISIGLLMGALLVGMMIVTLSEFNGVDLLSSDVDKSNLFGKIIAVILLVLIYAPGIVLLTCGVIGMLALIGPTIIAVITAIVIMMYIVKTAYYPMHLLATKKQYRKNFIAYMKGSE